MQKIMLFHANNINFHYRTNSVKIKDYFFNKLKKKPIFGPILTHFPNVWSKRGFSKKIRFCHTQRHLGFYHHAKNLEKTNDPIPRKHLERGKDGQNLFRRACRAAAAGPINILNERLAE